MKATIIDKTDRFLVQNSKNEFIQHRANQNDKAIIFSDSSNDFLFYRSVLPSKTIYHSVFFYLSTDFMDPPSFPLIECLRIANMHPPGPGPGLMMMNELIAVATGASPTTPSSTPHSPLLHLGVELERIKGGARARNGAL
jgi:hypothetical protein